MAEEGDAPHHTASLLWSFIGAILMIYGIIIFFSGLAHLLEHMPYTTKLANIHPDLIWGGVLFVFGIGFILINRWHIKKQKRNENS